MTTSYRSLEKDKLSLLKAVPVLQPAQPGRASMRLHSKPFIYPEPLNPKPKPLNLKPSSPKPLTPTPKTTL